MKKNIILLVVILITISLLGLIGIQLYWIRNAVAVKEAHFERGVSEAVTEAVYKYNKILLAQQILYQDKHNKQLRDFLENIDMLPQEELINENINKFLDSISNEQWEKIFIEDYKNSIDTGIFLNDFSLQNRQGYLQTPEAKEKLAQGFLERGRILNDLLEDLFSEDFFYSTQLNKSVLDSLITIELGNQGISAAYEFGVYCPLSNKLTVEKTGNYTADLLEEGYIFSLYPGTIFRDPEYLLVFFPGQKHYILAQMNIMLLISTVLIIVIISSFAYTIISLIKQKKLSLMKNDFINNMTHELKTPISTISLACQALSDRDVQKSEKLYQNYINIIDEENLRLEMMTEKVLQTALLDKGKLRLNKASIDIHSILNEAISKIGLQVERANGVIKTNFKAGRSIVRVDKFHMTNVFFNLLDNANKYTEEVPEILVTTENNQEGVFVSVKDNGIGISKANQHKVFENLYRISTGNVHNVKGFGLGLAYVKNIVELHNGEVSLKSEIKKGTTFTVFVPFNT